MIDACSRPIRYLRISVTDRCNLRCRYCMPPEGIEKQCHSDMLRYEQIVQIACAMAKLGVEKIRLTGGEPLVRKGLPGLVAALNGIDGIRDVSLTTNGLLLEEQLEALTAAGLKRVNISLDSLRPEVYAELTRGGDVRKVLGSVEACRRRGLRPVKLNVVLIDGVNDGEVDDFIRMADDGLDVRFIELMPVGEAAGWSRSHFVDLRERIAGRSDLEPDPEAGDGGPCRYYRKRAGAGRVGIINAISDHFCDACNRLRLTADGMLRTCLHSQEEVDLKPFLDDPAALEEAILRAVAAKPARHALSAERSTDSEDRREPRPHPAHGPRNMNAIGG